MDLDERRQIRYESKRNKIPKVTSTLLEGLGHVVRHLLGGALSPLQHGGFARPAIMALLVCAALTAAMLRACVAIWI